MNIFEMRNISNPKSMETYFLEFDPISFHFIIIGMCAAVMSKVDPRSSTYVDPVVLGRDWSDGIDPDTTQAAKNAFIGLTEDPHTFPNASINSWHSLAGFLYDIAIAHNNGLKLRFDARDEKIVKRAIRLTLELVDFWKILYIEETQKHHGKSWGSATGFNTIKFADAVKDWNV